MRGCPPDTLQRLNVSIFELEFQFAAVFVTIAGPSGLCQSSSYYWYGELEGRLEEAPSMAKRKADWSARWDLEATLDFIFSQAAQRVTLQFPDDLLGSSSEVAASIDQGCKARGRAEIQVPRPSYVAGWLFDLLPRALTSDPALPGVCAGRHHIQQHECG